MPHSHFWKLLVCLSAASTVAAAQAEEPSVHAERELLVSGNKEEQPPLIHGVTDVTVTVVVDAPVLRQEVRSPPGLEVRPHPFRDDAILVMPAPALVAQKAVTFSVPLVGGTVLTFTVVPARGKGDVLVRVRRAPSSAETEALVRRERELRAMLVHAVDAAVGAKNACALTSNQMAPADGYEFVCKIVGDRAYVRMRARCSGATVRQLAPPEGGISIEFEETQCTPKAGQCTATLVVRRQGTVPRGATIELRDQNGGLCQSNSLQPW